MTGTKIYVPVVTLSTQDNIKLIKLLESGFKGAINLNKHLPKTTNRARNRYLDLLTKRSFQGVNKLFILPFRDDDGRENHKQGYLSTVEIKIYNVMIDGRSFFDHPIKNDLKTYDNIRKIGAGQGDDYTTGCLLDYPYFKKYYKLIAIDLSQQHKLDADPKEIQQINFTGNLNKAEGATLLKYKSKGTVKVLWCYFVLI